YILVARRDHPPREKILRRARRLAVGERHVDDLVAGALRSIPRAVQRDEGAAAVVGWKLRPRVERKVERRIVRGQRDIGRDRLLHELGMLSVVTRLGMRTEIRP